MEKEIAVLQLAMKCSSELSWFNNIKELLKKYNLPSPSQLLEHVSTKKKKKKKKKKKTDGKNWFTVLSTVRSKPSGGRTLR